MAAPVFGPYRVIGAMSICGPAARMTDEDMVGQLVRQSAANLSQALGHRAGS